MMGRQVVHHDDVTGSERRPQDLIEVREKDIAVHRAIEQARCGQPVDAQGREERAGLPVLVWRVIVHATAAETAPVPPNQIRRNAAFIKKNKAFRVNRGGDRPPGRARGDDVGAILFGRACRFF